MFLSKLDSFRDFAKSTIRTPENKNCLNALSLTKAKPAATIFSICLAPVSVWRYKQFEVESGVNFSNDKFLFMDLGNGDGWRARSRGPCLSEQVFASLVGCPGQMDLGGRGLGDEGGRGEGGLRWEEVSQSSDSYHCHILRQTPLRHGDMGKPSHRTHSSFFG